MNVYHNWGRWIVRCASPSCHSATQLEHGQTTVVCACRETVVCDHGPLCGVIFQAVWPSDPAGIEAVLAPRKLENRHWYPHETIETLLAENDMHGVAV